MNTEHVADWIVFIARVQPPTLAHFQIMRRAVKMARKGVIVLAGSSNQPRTFKNPWSSIEREEMIRAGLPISVHNKITVCGLRDYPTDPQWVRAVQDHVSDIVGDDDDIAIIGHNKDDSSYYLEMFPQWGQIHVENIESINATDVRLALWTAEDDFDLKIGRNLAVGLHDWLKAWMLTDTYEQLVREYHFTKQYKEAWKDAPHPPTFVTVDALVVQAGHILLVRRRSEPGKGTYAMPGGFLGQTERIQEATLRELREETKLKVPTPVLRGNTKVTKVYDAPGRSLRGRTITHASLIELPPGPLPKVKGLDDADKAKWVPLNVFERMEDQMFEDHYRVIQDLLGHL